MASQEESPFRGLVTSWPALAAMAITLFSFLAARPTLESSRPMSVSVAATEVFRGYEVQVRLWQDPIGSVLNGKFYDNLENLTNGRPSVECGDKILVVLARVDLEMTPEQIESRRRERYATLAALNTAGYVPVESKLISYLDFRRPLVKAPAARYVSRTRSKSVMPELWKNPPPENKPKGKGEGRRKVNEDENEYRVRVAFEWFLPLTKKEVIKEASPDHMYKGVCVIWVGDDIDPGNSLRSLAFLRKKTEEVLLSKADGADLKCDFAVTGRIGSDTLRKIRSDDEQLAKDDEQLAKDPVNLSGVPLYVTYSTATAVRAKADETLPNSKLDLKYVIGSDALLMKALVAELKRRHVGIESDSIALISEWDSAYGRAMHREFIKALKNGDNLQDQEVSKPNNVFLFSYLSGLDGKLPVTTEPASDESKTPAKEAKPAEAVAGKSTGAGGDGDAQVDYLRRLVDKMKTEHVPFRAIGVLGSDPYDSLLILRALRPRFPEAVLFATDYDARLLQPTEFASTRNLILAAHFGPMLNGKLQVKVPPFRSSYDTASYLGCLSALQCPLLESVKENAQGDNTHKLVLPGGKTVYIPVRLYEVGRRGAFELTSYTEKEDPLGERNHQRDREQFVRSWWHLLIMPLCAVLLGLLLLTVSRNWQRLLLLRPRERAGPDAEPSRPWRGWLFIVALIVVPLLVAAAVYSHYHPDQEPFSMVDGLSLWPTISFRVFAIGLCLYYLFKTLEDLANGNRDIRQEFGFKASAGQKAPGLGVPNWLPLPLRETVGMWFWSPDTEKEHVPEVWKQFEALGTARNRLYRCAMVLVAYLVLFLLLYSLADYTVFRGRGPLAWWTGRITLDLAGIALVTLLTFVVDSTVLCYRFVTYLARCKCGWDDDLVRKTAERRGLTLAASTTGQPSTAEAPSPHADEKPDPAGTAVTELLRVRLIAASSHVVSRLIFDPFVVLLVLIVAQSPLFVAWQWNIPALTVAFLSASAALACAVILQRSAKDARTRALDALDRAELPLTGKDDEACARVAKIRSEIESLATGVFASFSQNPVVYALLLPLGGGGGLAALESLLPHL